jgi:hypothetical protein
MYIMKTINLLICVLKIFPWFIICHLILVGFFFFFACQNGSNQLLSSKLSFIVSAFDTLII